MNNVILQSPFNYTGSKSNLMNQLYEYFPSDCSICYDLFCGGGGFFMNSLNKFNKIVANDIITPLIELYSWLQNTKWDKVMEALYNSDMSSIVDQETYLSIRSRFNEKRNFLDFFILVCSCTNNMMRFNNKNEFNQTWGRRSFNLNIERKLKAYQNRLYGTHKVKFENKSFYDIKIEDGSFVYLDPPYLISEAGYNMCWSEELENKLYDYLEELNNRKIKFMLSNVMIHKGVTNPYLHRLKFFNITELEYNYGAVAKKRLERETIEIIVRNYL